MQTWKAQSQSELSQECIMGHTGYRDSNCTNTVYSHTSLELTDESARFCEGTPAPPTLLSAWWQCWPRPTLRSCARHERWYAWWCPTLSLRERQRLVTRHVYRIWGETSVWQVSHIEWNLSGSVNKMYSCVLIPNSTKHSLPELSRVHSSSRPPKVMFLCCLSIVVRNMLLAVGKFSQDKINYT